jgi:hypothetical protein
MDGMVENDARCVFRNIPKQVYTILQQKMARRVFLNSGYTPEVELFNLHDSCLKRNVSFWQWEIRHWAAYGLQSGLMLR